MTLPIGINSESRVLSRTPRADSRYIAAPGARETGDRQGGSARSRPTWGQSASDTSRTRSASAAPEFTAEQTLLLHVIASVADALGVYDEGGEERWIQVSPTVAARVGDAVIRAIMQEVATSTATRRVRLGSDPRRGPGAGVARALSAGGDCYRLRAVSLHRGFFGAGGSILVVAERLRGKTLSWERIRNRFGLTGREADVALLLAERRNNAEIARGLGISQHTARRHTEQVLLKIGAKRRHDVEEILRGATADDECGAEEA